MVGNSLFGFIAVLYCVICFIRVMFEERDEVVWYVVNLWIFFMEYAIGGVERGDNIGFEMWYWGMYDDSSVIVSFKLVLLSLLYMLTLKNYRYFFKAAPWMRNYKLSGMQ